MGLVTSLFHDAGYIRETERPRAPQRRGIHALPRHAQRAFPRALPADARHADWVPVATRIVHFTATKCSSTDPSRRSARSPRRASARHRRHDRADGGSLLSREVPRPAVSGIRARRHRGQRRAGACGSATAPGSTSCARRRISSTTSTSGSERRVRPRLSLRRTAVRRRQSVHGGDPAERAVPRGDPARQRWPLLRRNPPVSRSRRTPWTAAQAHRAPPEGSLRRAGIPGQRELSRA